MPASAMQGMSTRPVDFNAGSKVILSVIRNVGTIGAPNYNRPVLYQRYEYGSFAGGEQADHRRLRFVRARSRVSGGQLRQQYGPAGHESAAGCGHARSAEWFT